MKFRAISVQADYSRKMQDRIDRLHSKQPRLLGIQAINAVLHLPPTQSFGKCSNVASLMREIKLKDAKASLSSLVDDAARGELSIITRHGKPAAVVVGFEEWKRLTHVPSFGRLLMSAPVGAKDLPRRNRKPPRQIKF
jgi:antitoxin Phd